MALSQVLEFEGSARAENSTQSGEKCREKNEQRRKVYEKQYKWLPLRHFEVFESHRSNVNSETNSADEFADCLVRTEK
jgi:hypothetical protein